MTRTTANLAAAVAAIVLTFVSFQQTTVVPAPITPIASVQLA